MSKVICIDCGHGGSDPGAGNRIKGLRECDVALSVGMVTKQALEAVGYIVVMTRDTDVDVYGPYASLVSELQARCDISDNAEADILLSIHCNAFNTEAKGTETFHYAMSANGNKLASLIQNQVISLGNLVDRGVKSTPLYMTKHPDAVAVLIELAFIDNESDSSMMDNEDGIRNFGNALARGVTDYFAGT